MDRRGRVVPVTDGGDEERAQRGCTRAATDDSTTVSMAVPGRSGTAFPQGPR